MDETDIPEMGKTDLLSLSMLSLSLTEAHGDPKVRGTAGHIKPFGDLHRTENTGQETED